MLYGFINAINAHGKVTFLDITRDNGMDMVDGPEKTLYRLNPEDKTEIMESEAIIVYSDPAPVPKSNVA